MKRRDEMMRWMAKAGLMVLFLVPAALNATPYVPLEQAEAEAQLRADSMPVGPLRVTNELDELDDYIGTLEYFATLNWLTQFQVTEDGPNLGGQREGESTSNWNIIQTDNTQEALRDWSWYASMTGDLDRFRDYVENAWVYTLNFPAYLEEGGGNPNYYRVHNCGWGLVATMEFTEAFGYDETYIAYGDSCARYLDNWRLTWSSTGVQLNPLSAGFGAGALYLYGVYRNNQEWIDASQEIATSVKNWIDASPNRLNSNETWAMSGGTAMWGVVTALYTDDPEAGAAWIPTVSEFMDTYSGPGSWNNSWTVWYGHAWAAIHRVLGDQESYDNMIEVIEYLLEQVHLDDDAGLPGTEGQWADDQSWTSAYLEWYVLESMFEFDDVQIDAVAMDVLSPEVSWPVVVGNPTPITVRVANGGLFGLLPPDQIVTVELNAPGGTFSSVGGHIPFGQTGEITFPESWIPPSEGEHTLQLIVTTQNDERPENDTLEVAVTAVAGRSIFGVVRDSQTLEHVPATVYWEQLDVEPPRTGESHTDPGNNLYYIEALPGEYRLTAVPDHAPYLSATEDVTIADDDEYNVGFRVVRSKAMLISEDGDEDIIETIRSAFGHYPGTDGYIPYVWSIPEKGLPGDTINTVELVFWSSGNSTESVLDASQYESIESYLSGGSAMVLSGDNIMDNGDQDILADLFHVEPGQMNISSTIVKSAETGRIADNDSLFIIGAAAPQQVDGMVPLGNLALAEYTSQFGDHPLVVSHGDLLGHGYRTVVMSFGIEAINSETRFTPRYEFVERLIAYCTILLDAPEDDPTSLPDRITLATHPNPFNPSLTVDVGIPHGKATLGVYDLLGRQVAMWDLNPGANRVLWSAENVASGTYFVRVQAEGKTVSRRVTLLR
ncbi:T9SS type A sorting domain-containing protein [bacterium]|nr:T9SS type A sorting domain-containing protein [bacterium]